MILAFVSLFACKKENNNFSGKNNSSVTANDEFARTDSVDPCSHKQQWRGLYATDGLPYLYEADSDFISGGIAMLTHSPWSYFYTSIELPIPYCRNIHGDSTRFVAYLKNPSGEYGSVYPYDVSMWLYGAKDTGHVQFLAAYPLYGSYSRKLWSYKHYRPYLSVSNMDKIGSGCPKQEVKCLS